MSKVIRKIYFSWQDDREVKFLENMATQGYILTETTLMKYTFDECKPQNLVYAMDYLGSDSVDSSTNAFKDVDVYLQLHEDAGWTKVADKGSLFYFCKEKTGSASDAFYNDYASRRQKYGKLLGYWIPTLVLILFTMFYTLGQLEHTPSIWLATGILLIILIQIIVIIRIWIKFHQLKNKISE